MFIKNQCVWIKCLFVCVSVILFTLKMYIIISNRDGHVNLYQPIDNKRGVAGVALHEIFFKGKWFNISESQDNNWIKIGEQTLVIPDGYYGFCTLKEMLGEQGIILKLNDANNRIGLSFKYDYNYTFAAELAKMLGFSKTTFSDSSEGDMPADFRRNPMLFVHLDELNTNENLYNGNPSTVLRIIPSGNSAFCEHETKTFTNLQFKKLAMGYFDSLNFKIINQTGEKVQCDDVYIVLEIKENYKL